MFDSRHTLLFRSMMRKSAVLFLAALITLSTIGNLFAQETSKKPSAAKPSAAKPAKAPATSKAPKTSAAKPAVAQQPDSSRETTGIPWSGGFGVQETTEAIMDREREQGPSLEEPKASEPKKERLDRTHLPLNPNSSIDSQFPPKDPDAPTPPPVNPQTLGTSFTGATLADTNAFPPDSMGDVGPTQYIVGVNGRIRSFNKSTGLADNVLNTSMNGFFNSVRNGAGTSDPRVRYDRQSDRWFVLIINVALPNRVLLAVSDSGIITGATVWTFFFFQQDQPAPAGDAGCLADYPTLGVDANALYIGVNQFCGPSFPSLTFGGTTAFVIRKSSVLGAGPIVVTAFRNLTGTPVGQGLYTPQGVDNFDPGATEGYLVGVDNASFGTLVLRRVSNPGGTPTLSANIFITVPATTFPITVRHQGNNNGTNGRLDALDDRLYQAVIRNGRLWTAHNIGVDNTGVANGAGVSRDGSRWYELGNLDATPTLIQAGTLFAATGTNSVDERNYWIPSVMISGQEHMALGCSTAGTNEFANGATAGRLATDPLGTIQADIPLTASTTAYNPPGDSGGAFGRRWGDYSYVSLDPCDDMTMWTIQEFCNSTNSYGVRVVKLMAPPPVTPTTANPMNVPGGQPSVNVEITGPQVAGSGFYDPGPGFGCRLSASVSGGVVVNSVTYNSPTSVTLNISTAAAPQGAKNVTITNPDGQSVTANNLLIVGDGGECTFSINPTSQNFTFSGGTGNVAVTTQTGCTWTATSNAGFITITSGSSGSGNGTVNYSVAANPNTTPRTGTMTIAGETFTVNQDAAPPTCVTSISPPSASFGVGGGQGTIAVQAVPNGCTWTAVSDSPWLIILKGASGTGNGNVQYAMGLNPGTCRVGRITIGNFTHTVSQAGFQGGTCCTFSINPTSQNFTATGGSSSVGVTAPGGCAWTATSNAGFITITSGGSGSGNGTVNYSVAANPNTTPRTGTMTIAGQTFTVNQAAAPCTFSINPTSQNFPSTGGTGNVGVTAPGGCEWTATSNAGFITITSGGSGSGNGTVNYSVAANMSADPRTGTITVAGQTFTVNQAGAVGGCTFSINPTSQNFPFTGGSNSVSVITQAGCNWTATSNAGFITITSGGSGSGNGTVNYSVAANPNITPRAGTMTIAGETFTVNQAAAPCVFNINPTSQNFPFTGGSNSVNVTAQAGCNWTATSNAGFITITSGGSGSGNGTVNYSVAANPNTSPRTGTMTIAGQTFTVNQDAAPSSCTFSINPTSKSFSKIGGSVVVNVTATPGCSWTTTINAPWIFILSGGSGTGNGSVTLVLAFNTGPPRTGTVTIAGQTFTANQQ